MSISMRTIPAIDSEQGRRTQLAIEQCYQQLLEQVQNTLNLHNSNIELLSDCELRAQLSDAVRRQIETSAQFTALLPQQELLVERVLDDLVGLGPLEVLLRDEEVTEIMVNRHNQIYMEKGGRLLLSKIQFHDEQAVRRVLERIVTPLGRRVDASAPMVDARLPSGARVNGIIPPLAVQGTCLTIRKFASNALTMDDLIATNSVSPPAAQLLKLAVTMRQNIVICGGTGSGKTTLLNILADFIPEHERVITIEDAAELQLHHQNMVRLEARPANQEGEGHVSIRQLVINALRMRPDRIVVGECRAGESLDMLQAMNTGHDGSLTTLHANTPRDALRRLETMVLMAGVDLPLNAIRQQISSAVQLLVQVTRLANGKRMITAISELQGSDGDVLQVADLFLYSKPAEKHVCTQLMPKFCEQLTGSERTEFIQWYSNTESAGSN